MFRLNFSMLILLIGVSAGGLHEARAEFDDFPLPEGAIEQSVSPMFSTQYLTGRFYEWSMSYPNAAAINFHGTTLKEKGWEPCSVGRRVWANTQHDEYGEQYTTHTVTKSWIHPDKPKSVVSVTLTYRSPGFIDGDPTTDVQKVFLRQVNAETTDVSIAELGFDECVAN